MGKPQAQSIQTLTPDDLLPREFNTGDAKPEKLVSSFIALVRPLHSPQSPPWMVLSVETSAGITRLYDPFSRMPIRAQASLGTTHLFNLDVTDGLLRNLDLTKFRTTRLATECHIFDVEYGPVFCPNEYTQPFYIKALMFFQPSSVVPPSIQDCHLFVTYDDGQVLEYHPFDSRQAYYNKAFHRKYCYIDDIIHYKGNIYSLDRSGQLFFRSKRDEYCPYCKGKGQFHFCGHVVPKYIDNYDYGEIRRRKRLVVSLSGETLYMIDPVIGHADANRPSTAIDLYFRVSVLDQTSQLWRQVSSFVDGDVDQVLFVTREYCFFVRASEFLGRQLQLRNCIIFSADAFPLYCDFKSGWDYAIYCNGWSEIAIFSMDNDDEYSLPVKSYPGFPTMLWSPPPWILDDTSSPSQSAQLRSQRFECTSSHIWTCLSGNGSHGWVKLRRCKCQPPKYSDVKTSCSMNNLGKPYYECYACGEFAWVGEAEFRRSKEPQVVEGGTNTSIVAEISELKASMGKLLKTNVLVIMMTLFMYSVLFLCAMLK